MDTRCRLGEILFIFSEILNNTKVELSRIYITNRIKITRILHTLRIKSHEKAEQALLSISTIQREKKGFSIKVKMTKKKKYDTC